MTDSKDELALSMFLNGCAPSEVDEALGLPESYTHDIVIHAWRWTKGNQRTIGEYITEVLRCL